MKDFLRMARRIRCSGAEKEARIHRICLAKAAKSAEWNKPNVM
jgi:hypothetical protein